MWWHTVTHERGSEGGNWRMEWVASTLHTTSEHGVSSITTAEAHNSATSNRLNWGPRRFKWIPPFRLKTKSGFYACAITFQLPSTWRVYRHPLKRNFQRKRAFCFSKHAQIGSRSHSASFCSNTYRDGFSSVKRQGRKVYHSPPPSAEVWNEWSCTCTPPTCLYGVHGDNFTARSKQTKCLCVTHDTWLYRGADKSLARPGRKQATATEDFVCLISYL
jgi:hypothetical protein